MLYKKAVVTINKKQSGVVWVEFLIVSSTILISLFILIPLLGKFMDVRHKTEQSAQYMVWESSVWHKGKGKAQEKSVTRLLGEAQQRVLSEGNTLIYTGQENDNLQTDSFHYFIDGKLGGQNYTSILGARGGGGSAITIGSYSEGSQPQIEKVKKAVNVASRAVALAKVVRYKGGGLEKAAYAVGVYSLDGRKVMNEKGYYNVNDLSLTVKTPSWMPAFSSGGGAITMTTSKSLLVDGWGAGGRDNVREGVNKLQPERLVMRNAAKAYQFVFTNPIVSILNISEDLDMMDYDEKREDFYINSDELLDSNQLGGNYK